MHQNRRKQFFLLASWHSCKISVNILREMRKYKLKTKQKNINIGNVSLASSSIVNDKTFLFSTSTLTKKNVFFFFLLLFSRFVQSNREKRTFSLSFHLKIERKRNERQFHSIPQCIVIAFVARASCLYNFRQDIAHSAFRKYTNKTYVYLLI